MATVAPEVMLKSEATSQAYETILTVIRTLDGVVIEEKKTSLHVVAGKAAFLGIHPRKDGVRLNIVLARPLEGDRIVKSEQVSKSRFHNELDLKASDAVDDDLRSWIEEAYRLQTA